MHQKQKEAMLFQIKYHASTFQNNNLVAIAIYVYAIYIAKYFYSMEASNEVEYKPPDIATYNGQKVQVKFSIKSSKDEWFDGIVMSLLLLLFTILCRPHKEYECTLTTYNYIHIAI